MLISHQDPEHKTGKALKQQRLKDAADRGVDVEAERRRIMTTKKERADVLGNPIDWNEPKRKKWLKEKRLAEARARGVDVEAEAARIKESNKRAERVLGNPIDWEDPKRKKWLREKRINEAIQRGDHQRVKDAIEGRKDRGL